MASKESALTLLIKLRSKKDFHNVSAFVMTAVANALKALR